MGLEPDPDTFNPVIVDFYRQVGYLPEAIVNYLALLGWSLDDKTEHFTRDALVDVFSLDRVNKGPASFDARKLSAVQERHMLEAPLDRKVALGLWYLERAALVDSPASPEIASKVTEIVRAAGDRIKVAGDVLDYADFFLPDDRLPYDEKALEKRLRKPPEAPALLAEFQARLAAAEPFDAENLEKLMHAFVEQQGIKVGQIIHAVRVAVTGKSVGFGTFETLAILGRERCVARIERALRRA